MPLAAGRRPSTEPHSELDALIDQWTHDPTAVRDHTLELIRFGHVVMAPLVIGGLIIVVPRLAVIAAGLFYLAGMTGVLLVLPRRYQAAAIAVFDLLLISHVSASDPAVWTALLVPAVSAMTIGWLVSPRATARSLPQR